MKIDDVFKLFNENLIKQLTNLENDVSAIRKEIGHIQIDLGETKTKTEVIREKVENICDDISDVIPKIETIKDSHHKLEIELVKKSSFWGAISGLVALSIGVIVILLSGIFQKEKEVRYIWPPGYSPTRDAEFRDGGPVKDSISVYQYHDSFLNDDKL